VAHEHNLPAYVIFHDATLVTIAQRVPQSLDDLQDQAASARAHSRRMVKRCCRRWRSEARLWQVQVIESRGG